MNIDKRISGRRGFLFLVMIAATVYALTSAAIAINTVDKCGDESDAKHWSFFPPEWVCERPTF